MVVNVPLLPDASAAMHPACGLPTCKAMVIRFLDYSHKSVLVAHWNVLVIGINETSQNAILAMLDHVCVLK